MQLGLLEKQRRLILPRLTLRLSGLLMERPAAMTNRARKNLNPVRHLGSTVCQKHVSASSATPLRWLRSEKERTKSKAKMEQAQ
jgi:hypothetical protein